MPEFSLFSLFPRLFESVNSGEFASYVIGSLVRYHLTLTPVTGQHYTSHNMLLHR